MCFWVSDPERVVPELGVGSERARLSSEQCCQLGAEAGGRRNPGRDLQDGVREWGKGTPGQGKTGLGNSARRHQQRTP